MLEGILQQTSSKKVQWIKEGDEVTIFSDSQAALKALKAVAIKSQRVKETVDILNVLGAKLSSLNSYGSEVTLDTWITKELTS